MKTRPTSEVHRGALVGSVFARAVALVGRLGVALILATLLGVEEAGRYFILIGVAGLLALFGRFGGDRLALSETAQRPESSRQIFLTLAVRSATLSVILAVAALPFLAAVTGSIRDGWPALLGIVSVNTLLIAASTMRGRGEIIGSVVVGEVLPPLLQVLVYLGLGGDADAFRALLAHFVAYSLVGALAVARVWRRSNPIDAHDVPQLGVEHARPLVVLGLNGQLRQSFPAIAAGVLGTVADAGAMGAAFRIDRALAFPSEATRLAIAPQLNSAPNVQLPGEIHHRSVYWGRVAALVQLPVLILAFVFADPLFSALGAGFDTGANWLRILIIGGIVNTVTGPSLQVVLMSVQRSRLARTSTIGSIVLLTTTAALVVPLGVAAVAVGLAVAASVVSLAEWSLIRSTLGARVDVLASSSNRPLP